MRPGRRILTTVEAIVVVLVIFVVDMTISGYLLFTKASADTLQRSDAIIVLGGEHDGREDYALSLAREGWASTVVISDPYGPDDPVMQRVCHDTGNIEVICRRPEPLTTRGEAIFTRQLADARSWTRVIVVSWRYHLPRAELIFRQCFSDQPGSAVMTAVPRRYQYSPLEWEFVYAYQFGGLAKAIALGECL
jgi:uncharacterized SAM-binding protein YcdF (DUF218 family)